MKVCTDLGQSEKLAKFLPIESADMCLNRWRNNKMPPLMTPYRRFNEVFNMETLAFLIPCWSLSALLDILHNTIQGVSLNSFKDGDWNVMVQRDGKMIYADKDNPVDACVELILKLHEQKLV